MESNNQKILQMILLGAIILAFAIPQCHSDLMTDLIETEGYPTEKHTVQTKDGYILSVYRIPNLNKRPNKRKLMLLMHGMTTAGPSFIVFGRNESAAFKYSDAGYDVWIGNSRGTTFGRKHITMTPDDPKFWDYSWHEIGVFDIPATIDYILNHTNQTKLSYVGHSQGFVTLSELPEFNDKIRMLHVMTPAVIFKYNHPLVDLVMKNSSDFQGLLTYAKGLGPLEMLGHADSEWIKGIGQICLQPIGRALCRTMYSMVFGPSSFYFDELFPKVINHVPAGLSMRQLIHYAQLVMTGKFQNYDYFSVAMNMKAYGTPESPEYDLSKVRTNIHIMHGTTDWMSRSSNVPLFANSLGRYPIATSRFPSYNHADFAYGKNLNKIHRKILKVEKLLDD